MKALGAGALMLGAVAALAMAVAVRAQDAPGSTAAAVSTTLDGKQIYEDNCQACHMADAKGGGGAGTGIPALAGNPNLADPDFAIAVLLNGRGGMPWFTDMLTPAQMAAVLTHVRTHFNNYPEPVTEAEVKRLATTVPKRECETCG